VQLLFHTKTQMVSGEECAMVGEDPMVNVKHKSFFHFSMKSGDEWWCSCGIQRINALGLALP
jgi:hypothetical protein